MSDFDLKQYEELFNEAQRLRGFDGYICYKNISGLRISLFFFIKNFIDYKRSLDKFYSIDNVFSSDGLKRWYPQKNILTKLHNTVSSAYSYFEHVKKNKRTLKIEIRFEEIKSQNINDINYQLLKIIRDYSIHIGIIDINQKIELFKDGIKIFNRKDELKKDQFIEYIKKSTASQRNYREIIDYLNSFKESIDITELLLNFRKDLLKFHRELVKIIVSNHSDILSSFVKELNIYKQNALNNGLRSDLVLSDSQFRNLKYLLNLK